MTGLARRSEVQALESAMQGIDPVTDFAASTYHHFTDGVYMREVRRDADTVIVGKIHRYACANILLEGKVRIESEFEAGVYEAPCMWLSPAGNKRALYYMEDSRFMTVHKNPTNTQDLKELESILIAESFKALAGG
ncbi:MAG: hypothetical protein DRQ39_10995 [Gammaproteobacteria bacterium]|nr:MAG: hypothetical protein DRQ39_10995 [Gammaproteobacteria bacterium]